MMRATPEAKDKFLETLMEKASVTCASQAIGVSRKTVYEWRKTDEAFREAWRTALEIGCGALEDEAVRRAHEGIEEPVYHQGAIVGNVRKYSDSLLMFLLKAHDPKKYRERASIEHSGPGSGPVSFIIKG